MPDVVCTKFHLSFNIFQDIIKINISSQSKISVVTLELYLLLFTVQLSEYVNN